MKIAAPAPPAALPGFEGFRRLWSQKQGRWMVHVGPGEFYVTRTDEIIVTTLGSCVSVCVRAATAGVGGLNHFLLPSSPGHPAPDAITRYGCFAIERLINEVLKWGGRRAELEIKLFGGSRVIQGVSNIGGQNVVFVEQYLRAEGLAPIAADLGGPRSRRLRYYPLSGRAQIQYLPGIQARPALAREAAQRDRLAQAPIGGAVELF